MAFESDNERGLLYRIANALGSGPGVAGTAGAASSAVSGTIVASGGTATVAFTATTRTEVINPSTATLWAAWGTPSVNGSGSFPILPNGSFAPGYGVTGTLTILSTAANQPFTVNRYS